jgi:polysaccharide deacetylase family protein (PEP-CTERM system associated)
MPAAQLPLINALTVDVEDYFQVSSFERVVDRREWFSRESRVVASTERLLNLFAQHNVRGTFFILGWVAQKFPRLVRDIASAGHELACHSHWHRLIYDLTPAAFREDLRQSKQVIEDAAGACVTAFRAPSFSITGRSLWALEILVEEGFTVDSSIFPTRHDRYGMPDAKPEIHVLDTPAGPITELPMTVCPLPGVTLPVGGGGYFRLYPWAITRRLLARVNHSAGRPFVFYVHPWEVDPDQPRIKGGSRLSHFRHYVNLSTTATKIDRMLREFRFGTVSEVIAQSRLAHPRPDRAPSDESSAAELAA